MIAQRLLPAFALLSVAAAQSICSATGTATITNQAQAAAYTGCTRIAGSIAISPDAIGSIIFDGPQEIQGDFVAKDVGELNTLGSPTITSIGGSFTLTNLTKLNALEMERLEEVREINWVTLQALDFLTFTSNVTKATRVIIRNTFLSTLNGINLATVASLDISNNNRLREFTADLRNVTQGLVIGTNGRLLEVTFPDLVWAANMTFRNVSSVSLPNLQTVNGSLGFYGNFFTSVEAPELTSVGQFATGQGSLAFVANSKLTEIKMPLLKTVGGAAQIANNTELGNITFPALESVGGAVDFSGTFGTPTLAKLKNVRGGFNMQSTDEIDCSGFQSLRSSDIIQGKFICISTAEDAKSNDGTTTTGDGTSSASPSSSSNPATSYSVHYAVAGVSVVGGLMGMLV